MANTETSTETKVTHVAEDNENVDNDIDVDYDWSTRSYKKSEEKQLDNDVSQPEYTQFNTIFLSNMKILDPLNPWQNISFHSEYHGKTFKFTGKNNNNIISCKINKKYEYILLQQIFDCSLLSKVIIEFSINDCNAINNNNILGLMKYPIQYGYNNDDDTDTLNDMGIDDLYSNYKPLKQTRFCQNYHGIETNNINFNDSINKLIMVLNCDDKQCNIYINEINNNNLITDTNNGCTSNIPEQFVVLYGCHSNDTMVQNTYKNAEEINIQLSLLQIASKPDVDSHRNYEQQQYEKSQRYEPQRIKQIQVQQQKQHVQTHEQKKDTGGEVAKCYVCNKTKNVMECSQCQAAFYCSREHQIKDWPRHSKECQTKHVSDIDNTSSSINKEENDNDVNIAYDNNINDNNNSNVCNQLTPAWDRRYTSDGRVYYQNNITKQTQWNKPMDMGEPVLPIQPSLPVQVQTPTVVTVVTNDRNAPQYQQQIQQPQLPHRETVVVHYIPQETIVTVPTETELTVIQSVQDKINEPNANTKQRGRKSTIGEKNLEKRTTFGTVFIISGIILAIMSIGFTLNDIFDKMPSNDTDDNFTDVCDDFNYIDPIIFELALIMLPLGFISLLIGIVEYKTGDCACLRHCLMNIFCLTWTKLCCCYDQTSAQLLMLFNTLFWFVMLILDIIGFYLFVMANRTMEANSIYEFCEKNEIGWDTYLEGIVMCLGFMVSIIELFYSGVGKCMLKICCFLFVFAGIGAVVAAALS